MTEQASLVLTVEQARKILNISRHLAYELVRTGRIPSIRLGRVIRIPRFGLERWLAEEAGLPQPSHDAVTSSSQQH